MLHNMNGRSGGSHARQSKQDSQMAAALPPASLSARTARPVDAASRSFGTTRKAKSAAPKGIHMTTYQKSAWTGTPKDTSKNPNTLMMKKAAGTPMIAQLLVSGPRGVITLRNVHSNTPSDKPIKPKDKNTQ